MGGAAPPRCARAAVGEGAGPHLHGRGREEGAADLAAGAIDPSWPPPLGSAEGEERRRRGREEDGAAAAGLTAEPCAAREEGGGRRGEEEDEDGRWARGQNGLFTSSFS